ncbi:hypothetical protein GCM10029964_061950 [Kibdelosporangium lantanae]
MRRAHRATATASPIGVTVTISHSRPITLEASNPDGYRESTESWADLPRDCARRGMTALMLAIGDGASPQSTSIRT